MLWLRLKELQMALRAGRLEDAAALLADPAVRQHCRGQQALGQLAAGIAERAEAHLAQGDAEAACSAARWATEFAGRTPALIALLGRCEAAKAAATQRRRAYQAAVEQALRLRRARQLSAAESMLAGLAGRGAEGVSGAPDTPAGHVIAGHRAQALLDEVEMHRTQAQQLLEAAEVALAQGRLLDCARRAAEAKALHRTSRPLAGLLQKLAEAATDAADRNLVAGQVEAAEALVDAVANVVEGHEAIAALKSLLQGIAEVGESTRRGDLRPAETQMRRLARQWPHLKWLAEAAEHLGTAAAAIEAAQATPLGSVIGRIATVTVPDSVPGRATTDSAAGTPLPSTAPRGGQCRRFLLRVDGGGSFLVLRDAQFTLGPLGGAMAADVRLVMPAAQQAAVEIRRSDGDYFCNGALLVPGRKVSIGPSCSVRLYRPNPASGTALLTPGGCRVPVGDVRQLLLMDREIVIGPEAGAHVRVDGMAGRATLSVRDGSLVCRATAPMEAGGSTLAAGAEAVLCPGVPVRIAGISVIVEESGEHSATGGAT